MSIPGGEGQDRAAGGTGLPTAGPSGVGPGPEGRRALDPRRVRRRFERAAASYDAHAALPELIGERLLGHLDPVRLSPRAIVDLGTGTGTLLAGLGSRYPRVPVVGLDASSAMLVLARRRRLGWRRRALAVQADAHRLPLATGAVDLAVASLLLPWCDARAALAECARVTAPGGLVLLASLGPDTLCELRECADALGGPARVHEFADMHEVSDAMVGAGFEGVVGEVERLRVEYPDVDRLFGELRALGGGNALRGAPPGLGGREALARLRQALAARFARAPVVATMEVVYAHGWRRAAQEPVRPRVDLQRRR